MSHAPAHSCSGAARRVRSDIISLLRTLTSRRLSARCCRTPSLRHCISLTPLVARRAAHTRHCCRRVAPPSSLRAALSAASASDLSWSLIGARPFCGRRHPAALLAFNGFPSPLQPTMLRAGVDSSKSRAHDPPHRWLIAPAFLESQSHSPCLVAFSSRLAGFRPVYSLGLRPLHSNLLLALRLHFCVQLWLSWWHLRAAHVVFFLPHSRVLLCRSVPMPRFASHLPSSFSFLHASFVAESLRGGWI